MNCDCFIFEFSKLTLIYFSDYSYITYYNIALFLKYANPKIQVRFKKGFGPIVDQL